MSLNNYAVTYKFPLAFDCFTLLHGPFLFLVWYFSHTFQEWLKAVVPYSGTLLYRQREVIPYFTNIILSQSPFHLCGLGYLVWQRICSSIFHIFELSSFSVMCDLLTYRKNVFIPLWKYTQDHHILTEKMKWSITTQYPCQTCFLDWISNLSGKLFDFPDRLWVICPWIFS